MTGVMLFFQAALNRYTMDFVPLLVLLGAVGALLTARSLRQGRAAATAGIALLSGYSCLFNLLAGFRHNELFKSQRPAEYARIAALGNWIPDLVDRSRGTPYGPVEMTVVFPRDRVGHNDPLVTTGETFLSDFVVSHYEPGGVVSFGLIHAGGYAEFGTPVQLEPSKPHTVRIDLPSLYPPAESPYFARLAPDQALYLRRRIRVEVDGQVVLSLQKPVYDPSGPNPSIGTAEGHGVFDQPFSGKILAVQRLPPPPAPVSQRGAFRLYYRLPPFSQPLSEPLVCTGATGRGDLVYLRRDAPDRIAIGFDHWGVGGQVSRPVTVDPAITQTIEVDFDALHESAESGPNGEIRGRVRIAVNRQVVLEASQASYRVDPATIVVGSNPIGFSTAQAFATGTVTDIDRLP